MLLNYIDPGLGYEQYERDSEKLLIFITNIIGVILFTGTLIALLTNIINQRIDKVKNGEVYYSFSDHIVIIGYDHICDELVEHLHSERTEFVIQTSRDVEEVRKALFHTLDEDKYEKYITVVSGNRALENDVKNLNIDKCREVFLLGDMEDDAHDSKNIDCLKLINDILEEKAKKTEKAEKLKCHILFERHTTFAAFEQQELRAIHNNIDFIPFNFYDMWAQKVLVKKNYQNGLVEYEPLDHEPIGPGSKKHVHLVIIGMSKMGIALGMQAAHVCHYPNFIDDKNLKTRITFIDEAADLEMRSLQYCLRGLFEEVDYSYVCYEEKKKNRENKKGKNFTDIEFKFIKAHFKDREVQDFLVEAAKDKKSYLTVAVTLPDSASSLGAALHLPVEVFDQNTNVLVWQDQSHAIVSMLCDEVPGQKYRKYKNMRPFGMIDNCYEFTVADEFLPMMIKLTHDRAYDKENTDKELTDWDFTDDDKLRDVWNTWKDNANVSALKASNRYAANSIYIKERSLGIQKGKSLEDEQTRYGAQMEHNRWVMEKLLVGFRAPTEAEARSMKASKELRKELKERFIHPDIAPYGKLGRDDKNLDVKLHDINICNAIPKMLEAIGQKEEEKERRRST
jgi:hypothetical protein